jgi:hypothetical protein
MTANRFRRRTLLLAIASGPATARWALASSPLTYSIALQPAQALLGDLIVAALVCTASAPTEAVTFDDASLMLELRRLPAESEAARVFPNRGGAERAGVQVRTAPVGRRRLAREERLMRELDLVGLYPRWTLDTGNFQLSYQIGTESLSSHAGPAGLTIESGPDAVPALLKRLEHADRGVRARSAGLLHRMTAHVVGYAPDVDVAERTAAIARWRDWWEATGRKMPWNFLSTGVTFGAETPAPPVRRRSQKLGGIAYQRRPLGSAGTTAVASALAEWQRSTPGDAAALHGRAWIADQMFSYPSEDVALDPGGDVATMLEAALSRLAHLAASSSPEATGAPIILATVARCPDQHYVAALSAVQSAARGSPAWRQVGFVADGLLDLLDPARTPTGG